MIPFLGLNRATSAVASCLPFARCGGRILGASFAVLLTAGTLAAQSADDDDIVELSPFTIEANSDVGYAATQTLSGTRLRQSLDEVAAAVDIMTPEFLRDIGAVNLDDALAFGINTASWDGGLVTEPDGLPLTDFANNIQFQIRGFPSQSVTRDFFTAIYKPDLYSSSRLTMSRGPNAILYGIGSPAGIIDSSSSRALFNKNFGEVSARTDSEGSFRSTIDLNRELIDQRLAIRVAGMTESRETWRENEGRDDDRIFIATTARLREKTELRASYEQGTTSEFYSQPWPVYDGFSAWVAAGSQLENSVGAISGGNGIPAKGIDRLSNVPYLVDASFGPAGAAVPVLSWRRMGSSAYPRNSGLLDRPSSLLDESIIPFDLNVTGGAKQLDQEFSNLSVFLEQQFTENLFVELAYNYQDSEKAAWSGLIGGPQPLLQIDVNAKLPNGAANPNAGAYYFEGTNVAIYSPRITEQQETMRASASYQLDLRERAGWLGRHDIAVLAERRDREDIRPSLDLQNSSPALFNTVNGLRGATAFPLDIGNPRNRVKARYYVDPAAGDVSLTMPDLSRFAHLYSGGAVPTPDASGYTPVLAAAREQSNSITRVDSFMGVLMSRFWDDRLITTLGLRSDEQTIWIADQTAGADGLFVDPHTQHAKDAGGTMNTVSGTTSTVGVVFKATPKLSFTANLSDSFLPNGDLKDVAGELLGPTTAEGFDVGFRLKLLEEKLLLSLAYFETTSEGTPSAYVRTLGGNIRGGISRVWDAIAAYENNPIYGTAPYNEQSAWDGVLDQDSKGVELSVTGNITNQWRFKFSVAQQEAVLTSFGPRIQDYVATYLPLIEQRADWLALATNGNNTVADEVQQIRLQAARKAAMSGVKNTTQPEWSANLVNNYAFSRQGVLKGFSIGQSVRYRSASGIGYAEDATTQLFQVDQVFKGNDSIVVGAWVTYQRALSDNLDLRLQLNIDNVFNSDLLEPYEALDDGTGNPVISRYRLNAPRRTMLTATLSF